MHNASALGASKKNGAQFLPSFLWYPSCWDNQPSTRKHMDVFGLIKVIRGEMIEACLPTSVKLTRLEKNRTRREQLVVKSDQKCKMWSKTAKSKVGTNRFCNHVQTNQKAIIWDDYWYPRSSTSAHHFVYSHKTKSHQLRSKYPPQVHLHQPAKT